MEIFIGIFFAPIIIYLGVSMLNRNGTVLLNVIITVLILAVAIVSVRIWLKKTGNTKAFVCQYLFPCRDS